MGMVAPDCVRLILHRLALAVNRDCVSFAGLLRVALREVSV
jgi:hypothetical protein